MFCDCERLLSLEVEYRMKLQSSLWRQTLWMITLTHLRSPYLCGHETSRHTASHLCSPDRCWSHKAPRECVYCASSREHTSCSAGWEMPSVVYSLNTFPFSYRSSFDLANRCFRQGSCSLTSCFLLIKIDDFYHWWFYYETIWIQAWLLVHSEHPWLICIRFVFFLSPIVMENSTEETSTESANCTLTGEEVEQSDDVQSPAPTETQTTHTGRNLSISLSICLSVYP